MAGLDHLMEMDTVDGRASLMIVSDLDHTMVDHHDPENLSLLRFNALWESAYRTYAILVFSTGRSPTLYKQLRKEKPMITPDITIMSVGTEITYGEAMTPDEGWINLLNQKWDRDIVVEESGHFPQLKSQPETEQRPHKVSFYVEKQDAQEVIKSLSEKLLKRGLDVKIIYSGSTDLDVLPQGAGKGQALAYLLKKFDDLGKRPSNTLVCGDSGNDSELFSLAGFNGVQDVYGVMVSNAHEELLQWYAENGKENGNIIHASERCASAIIQAIGHFNLGPHISPRNLHLPCRVDAIKPADEIVKIYVLYEMWRRGETVDPDVIQYFKDIIHPSGVIVLPSGVVKLLNPAFAALESFFGDKKGKNYRVWVDKLITSQVGPVSWLMRFDKWEIEGEVRRCCLTTLLFGIEPDAPRGFKVMHIHQTWLRGYAAQEDQERVL